MGRLDIGIVRPRHTQRFKHVYGEHVEVTCSAELLCDPSQLAFDAFDVIAFRARDDTGKERETRSQAPEPNTHLMQRVRPPFAHGGLVGDDLPDTVAGDGAKRFGAGHARRDLDRHRLLHTTVAAVEQREAALRLAFHGKTKRHGFGKLTGKIKQRAFVARPQLELQLTDRRGSEARCDLPLVDCKLDLGTIVPQPARPAPKPRMEARLQASANLRRKQRCKRGSFCGDEIRLIGRNGLLPLLAFEELGLVGCLDRLYETFAGHANPQENAGLTQDIVLGIIVGRDQLARLSGCIAGEHRVRQEVRQLGRIELELELDLLGFLSGLASNHSVRLPKALAR